MIAPSQHRIVFLIVGSLCLLPFVTPGIALLAGAALSFMGIHDKQLTSYTSFFLQASIVLMGFGMNLDEVIAVSSSGFFTTAISVAFVMLVGWGLGKLFKVDANTALLISCGTAICGGSAIAAVAPVINSRNHQISFSLAVVFVLNALALLIFPIIGHLLDLSQEVFGYWAAIAIHDTSSVVGAGAAYGEEALQIATTVKLVRALWIIPLSLVLAFANRHKESGKVKIPWFIALFVMAIVISHFCPQLSAMYNLAYGLGKQGMVVALFLIGSCISIKDMKEAGPRSFALGVILWFIIGSVSLVVLYYTSSIMK